MSHDHLAKNRKLLPNWWPVKEKKSRNNIFQIHIKYFKHLTFGMTVRCPSVKIMRENKILNAQL